MTDLVFTDSHCHLNLLDLSLFDNEVANVVKIAQSNQVQHFLNVCVEIEKFPELLATTEQFPEVFCSVGLHPNEEVAEEPSVEQLVQLAQHKKVIAIGETGLDYYRSEADNRWQIPRLRRHISAAKQAKLPLIIHTRQAKQDTLDVLAAEEAKTVGGVFHCFTEDWEMAQMGMEMNFYISFSGIVTFKNAKALQAVDKQVPLERLLIETDCPYLAPVPYRGKPNQPAYVRHVAEFLANLKGVSVATIAEITTQNYQDLFLSKVG
ncbi:MAG: TatD family hydrolase [Pseudomonadota bacterium]